MYAKSWSENLKRRHHSEDQVMDRIIILKFIWAT